jgi:hypothetical protein
MTLKVPNQSCIGSEPVRDSSAQSARRVEQSVKFRALGIPERMANAPLSPDRLKDDGK